MFSGNESVKLMSVKTFFSKTSMAQESRFQQCFFVVKTLETLVKREIDPCYLESETRPAKFRRDGFLFLKCSAKQIVTS